MFLRTDILQNLFARVTCNFLGCITLSYVNLERDLRLPTCYYVAAFQALRGLSYLVPTRKLRSYSFLNYIALLFMLSLSSNIIVKVHFHFDVIIFVIL